MAGNNMQLNRTLLFSGTIPIPKGEVGAQTLLDDINARRRAGGGWNEETTMGNVAASLIGDAHTWWTSTILMEASEADEPRVKVHWDTFQTAFKAHFRVMERQEAMHLGDLTHQKKGETVPSFLLRVATAARSLDYIRDLLNPIADPPTPQVVLASIHTAADGVAGAEQAVTTALNDHITLILNRRAKFVANTAVNDIAKKSTQQGLISNKLRDVALKFMDREHSWLVFRNAVVDADIQMKRNGKVAEINVVQDDDDEEEEEVEAGKINTNKNKKKPNKPNQTLGNTEPWMTGRRCGWCNTMNHTQTICRK